MSVVTALMKKSIHPDDGVYAIVAEVGNGDFVVKIGRTSAPHQRFATLVTGIPFNCTMLWMPVGFRKRACRIERELHKKFADRNTVGEWFKFRLEEKQVLHNAFREYHEKYRPSIKFAWLVIPRSAAMVHASLAKNGGGRGNKPRGA